ncbi:MAG: hypothetical protein ACI4OA_04275 [Selenomonadaceae bacterium]
MMKKLICGVCLSIACVSSFANAPAHVCAAPAADAETADSDKEKPIDLGLAWYMFPSSVGDISDDGTTKSFSLVLWKGNYYNKYYFRRQETMKKNEFDYYNTNDRSWRHYDWGTKTPLFKAYTIGYDIAFNGKEY